MEPFEQARRMAPQGRATDDIDLPQSLSLQTPPSPREIGREIGIILLVCLGVALVGVAFAQF
jgi:hypothetical protein